MKNFEILAQFDWDICKIFENIGCFYKISKNVCRGKWVA